MPTVGEVTLVFERLSLLISSLPRTSKFSLGFPEVPVLRRARLHSVPHFLVPPLLIFPRMASHIELKFYTPFLKLHKRMYSTRKFQKRSPRLLLT